MTDLSLALLGETVGVNETVSICPLMRRTELLFSVIPVTYCFTSTSQDADLPLPSLAVTVIVAVPLPTPVTTPEVETIATDVFELVQFTPVLLAVEGLTVAVRVALLPL